VLEAQSWRKESVIPLMAGILVFFVGILFLIQLGLKASGIADSPHGPFWNLLGGLAALQFPVIILTHGSLRTHQLRWNTAFGLAWNPSAIAWGIGLGLAAVLAGYPILGGMIHLLQSYGYQPETQKAVQFLATAPRWQQAIIGVFAVVFAAIAEETLFRGILYRLGETRIQRGIALITTSILFGAVHANAAAFVPLTLFGAGLCWAYQRTGNLLTCIIAHATFNSVGLGVAILQPASPFSP
jgi:membrane protease YdiL (CAAX protease family)